MINRFSPKYILYVLAPIIVKIVVSHLTSECFGVYLQYAEGIDDIVELNKRFAESGLGVVSAGLSCLVLAILYLIWWKGSLHKIQKPTNFKCYVNCMLLGILLSISLNYGMTEAIKVFNLHGYDSTERIFFAGGIVLRILCLGIISPFCEEVLFRGLVFDRLKERLCINRAVIGSALLFGIYHGNAVQFVYASIMGLVLGIIMVKKDDIYAPFAFHSAANIAIIIIEILQN